MYRDNTLIPSEAIRLLGLGVLATGEITYAELAGEVRHFAGHVVGPSLDLMGAPIEMCERQLVRLTELHGRHAGAPGHLSAWLAHETAQARERLAWFRDLQKSLG